MTAEAAQAAEMAGAAQPAGAAHERRVTPVDLLHAVRESAGNILDLAVAEARLAALSAFGMLFLVIMAAAATVVGWSLLVVVGISLLADLGISWRWSAFIIAVLHGLAALLCWEMSVRLSRNLTLPVLRRAAKPAGRGPEGE